MSVLTTWGLSRSAKCQLVLCFPLPLAWRTHGCIKAVSLIVLILARHTSKLKYRVIVNTIKYDSDCRYVLSLHISVSWPSTEGIRSMFRNYYCKVCTMPHSFFFFCYEVLRKQQNITTIQNHNKLKKRGTSLRGPLRTPDDTPTFHFNRRGTGTQTLWVQDSNI
jgi:hypothetical protein